MGQELNNIALSAIVICKNEEKNIRKCLQSLQWLKEIIVVDSYSEDDTEKIAREYSNVRFLQREWSGFVNQKKFAISQASNDWIFWLDADEWCSSSLSQEVVETLTSSLDEVAAGCFPRKTYFLGRWIRHTGWYPGRVTRLFNKHVCSFNNRILHEGIICPPQYRTFSFQSDIHHNSYPDLEIYFQKMCGYGAYGAKELLQRGRKFSFFSLIFNPFAAFIKFYFFKLGFLDGARGLIISIGSGFSTFIKYSSLWDLVRNKCRNQLDESSRE